MPSPNRVPRRGDRRGRRPVTQEDDAGTAAINRSPRLRLRPAARTRSTTAGERLAQPLGGALRADSSETRFIGINAGRERSRRVGSVPAATNSR